jgi:hypothetical protein
MNMDTFSEGLLKYLQLFISYESAKSGGVKLESSLS